MKGIFVVPVHGFSKEEIINIDIHNIKENFDLICKDMIRLDFPKLDGYRVKYCVPVSLTAEMLSNVINETDNIIEIINRATLTLVDCIRDVHKNDYIILIFRISEVNNKLMYNQKKQNEIRKWLSDKYKIAKNKIRIFNYK